MGGFFLYCIRFINFALSKIFFLDSLRILYLSFSPQQCHTRIIKKPLLPYISSSVHVDTHMRVNTSDQSTHLMMFIFTSIKIRWVNSYFFRDIQTLKYQRSVLISFLMKLTFRNYFNFQTKDLLEKELKIP